MKILSTCRHCWQKVTENLFCDDCEKIITKFQEMHPEAVMAFWDNFFKGEKEIQEAAFALYARKMPLEDDDDELNVLIVRFRDEIEKLILFERENEYYDFEEAEEYFWDIKDRLSYLKN